MAKDYAKRVLTTYKKPKKKKFRIEFLLVSLVLMALLGYWGFSHRDQLSSKAAWLAFLKPHSSVKKIHTSASPNTTASDEMNIHFDFYDQLPNQHVPDLDEAANESAYPQPVPSTEKKVKTSAPNYVLLFGQFKNASEASELRVSLLLADCEADLVEAGEPESKVFRVQKGPFTTQEEAKTLQNQLEKKGVSSDLQKV